ncbi:MAG: PIG-L deacetylase family protein [Gammaproteobacteria bacterium]
MKETILFISPHTDDSELGAGGALIKFLNEGKKVYVAAFCSAKESLKQYDKPENLLSLEFYAGMNFLGLPKDHCFLFDFPLRDFSKCRQIILDRLIELKNTIKPDLVIIPSKNDIHQDHSVVHIESIRAFKDTSIWCYELPWNQMKFEGTCYIKLDNEIVNKKIKLLGHYKSQIEINRPYFQEEFIRSLARIRGCQSFTDYAEAFEIIREYA